MTQADRIEQIVSKAVWHLMPLIGLGTFVKFLDRANIGFAALTLNRDLGFNQAVFGFVANLTVLGYLLFEVPSTLVQHKVGARIWIARIMITWGLISAATAFVSNAFEMSIVRFLLGVAEAGYSPGILLFLSLWFPKKYLARVFALFIIAEPLSLVIGGPVSGLILGLDGALGFKGWQWLFILEAAPAVVLGVLLLWLLPATPAEAKWLTPDERALLAAEVGKERREAEAVGLSSMWNAFLNPRLLVLTLAYAGIVGCAACVIYFLPQIVKATGASVVEASFLSAIPWAGAALGGLLVGQLVTRGIPGERLAWMTSLAVAIGLAGSAILGKSPFTLIFLTLTTAGIIGIVPSFWTLPPKFLTGAPAAAAFGFINAVGALASFAGSSAFGWVADKTGGYDGSLWVFSGVGLCSAILFFIMSSRLPSSQPAAVAVKTA